MRNYASAVYQRKIHNLNMADVHKKVNEARSTTKVEDYRNVRERNTANFRYFILTKVMKNKKRK